MIPNGLGSDQNIKMVYGRGGTYKLTGYSFALFSILISGFLKGRGEVVCGMGGCLSRRMLIRGPLY
jgi:hypothetical protein